MRVGWEEGEEPEKQNKKTLPIVFSSAKSSYSTMQLRRGSHNLFRVPTVSLPPDDFIYRPVLAAEAHLAAKQMNLFTFIPFSHLFVLVASPTTSDPPASVLRRSLRPEISTAGQEGHWILMLSCR